MTEYTTEMRRRGWDQQSLAAHWEISVRKLQRICRNPTQRDWDALNGVRWNVGAYSKGR